MTWSKLEVEYAGDVMLLSCITGNNKKNGKYTAAVRSTKKYLKQNSNISNLSHETLGWTLSDRDVLKESTKNEKLRRFLCRFSARPTSLRTCRTDLHKTSRWPLVLVVGAGLLAAFFICRFSARLTSFGDHGL